MKNLILLGASMAAVAALSAPSFAQCGTGITLTTFNGGNGQAGNMFDVIVGAADMTIDCMDLHHGTIGQLLDVDIWYVATTCVGNETNPAAWTLLSSQTGIVSAGGLQQTRIDISGNGVTFTAGQSYGIYVNLVNYGAVTSLRYTNSVGTGVLYPGDDCDVQGQFGVSLNWGATYFPRNWNGILFTSTGPAGPGLALACAAGVATADLSGFSANGPIAVVYGSPSAYVHGGVQCNGVTLDLTPTTAPIIVLADANGDAQIIQGVPTSACGSGLLVQAVDGATCVASNSAAL